MTARWAGPGGDFDLWLDRDERDWRAHAGCKSNVDGVV